MYCLVGYIIPNKIMSILFNLFYYIVGSCSPCFVLPNVTPRGKAATHQGPGYPLYHRQKSKKPLFSRYCFLLFLTVSRWIRVEVWEKGSRGGWDLLLTASSQVGLCWILSKALKYVGVWYNSSGCGCCLLVGPGFLGGCCFFIVLLPFCGRRYMRWIAGVPSFFLFLLPFGPCARAGDCGGSAFFLLLSAGGKMVV